MAGLPDETEARSFERRAGTPGHHEGRTHPGIRRTRRAFNPLKMQQRTTDHDLFAEHNRAQKTARPARLNSLRPHQTSVWRWEMLPEVLQDPS